MRLLIQTLLIVLLGLSLAQAQERSIPSSAAQMQLSFAPIAKQTAPAVVNIYTKRKVVQQGLSPLIADPLFQHFFGSPLGMLGMPRERVVSSLGSGVIVDASGTIVTNHHVIKDAQDITVILADKRELDATLFIDDEQSDLAILKVKTDKPLPFLQLDDSDAIEVGDLVLAIGNPFGVGQTVTSGIVSAPARSAATVSDFGFFIQTDAAINPGNSGGALVDMNGRLVGVPTAIYTKSGGSNGIGFAIPSNMVRTLIEGAHQAGEKVTKPWLGASYQPLTRDLAESLGMDAPNGVLVREVFADSPAAKAGVKPGDVIVGLAGKPVEDVQSLRFRVATAKVNSSQPIEVLRNAERHTMTATLTAPPDSPARDVRTLKGVHPLREVTVANLNPAVAAELNIGAAQSGVVILKSRGNLQAGDIIESVNRVAITSTKQLEDVMNKPTNGWRLMFNRGGESFGLTVMQ